MFTDNNLYLEQFTRVFSRTPQLSDIKPSEWAEKNIIVPGKGLTNYDFNPYCREIIDCLAPDHPCRKLAVMKGSQITFSSGVIMPILGYIIKENPGNTLFSVGKPSLLKPAIEKLDLMIDGAKLKDFVANYTTTRAKNNKSGDTDEMKYFGGGYIKSCSIQDSKNIAQMDIDTSILDDFDSMKGSDKSGGDFLDLIEMRSATKLNTYKLVMISTPLLKGFSNIEAAYLRGDQRRFFVQCPCCHEPIIFKWKVSEGEVINPLIDDIAKYAGGVDFERNHHDQLIKSSVRYICYKCGGNFTDHNKQKMIRDAVWMPTAIPRSDDYYSYHISALYAPYGMFNWAHYAAKYVEAKPKDKPCDESKMHVLVNTCFGETYELAAEAPKASDIQTNQRNYTIGTIPESLSKRDGNGRIVLLTFACDCNGTVAGVNRATKNDARVDYEVVAHSESGATYSVVHGSVGTFIPLEGSDKANRDYWTYEQNKQNSVWPVLFEIITKAYKGDETGLNYFINTPGVDVGMYSNFVESFIDWTIGRNPANPVVGVRGKKEETYQRDKQNMAFFEQGKARNDVYFLQVGLIKDILSNYMKLKWDGQESQPPNFMNFPPSERYICPVKQKYYRMLGLPYDGDLLYQIENYFSHYETEERKIVPLKDGGEAFRWSKKKSNVQNHIFDCRVYNLALKEIIMSTLKKQTGAKEFTWTDYVKYVLE